jgi:hypothetical protein
LYAEQVIYFVLSVNGCLKLPAPGKLRTFSPHVCL